MAKSITLLLIKAGLLILLLGSQVSCSTIEYETIDDPEDKWAMWDYCEQFSYDGETWMNCMSL